jgi:hypothetical protein
MALNGLLDGKSHRWRGRYPNDRQSQADTRRRLLEMNAGTQYWTLRRRGYPRETAKIHCGKSKNLSRAHKVRIARRKLAIRTGANYAYYAPVTPRFLTLLPTIFTNVGG